MTFPRAAACAAATMLAASAGCTDTHVLSGAFRALADNPVTLGAPGDAAVWPELVLGHYGPDVAGIVWLCATADCTVRGTCRHIERGSWSGGVFTFAFEPPVPCDAGVDPAQCAISARLVLYGDDDLEGTFRTVDGSVLDVKMTRTRHAGELVKDDLSCDDVEGPE